MAGDMRMKREGRGENKESEEQGGCELSHPRNIFHEIDNSLKTYFASETNENRPIYVISKKRNCEITVQIFRACEDGCELIVLFLFVKCIAIHASLVRRCAGT